MSSQGYALTLQPIWATLGASPTLGYDGPIFILTGSSPFLVIDSYQDSALASYLQSSPNPCLTYFSYQNIFSKSNCGLIISLL